MAIKTEARAKAVKNAIEKAETLTGAAGAKLGKILSLNENKTGGAPVALAMESMTRSAKSVPIAAGETGYSVSISMEWEILQ